MKIRSPDNVTLERKLGRHMLSFRLGYFAFFERMYDLLKNRKSHRAWFGDADFWFELIHDEPKSVEGYVRVLVVHDSATCSDKSRWIVIIRGDRFKRELHVRTIYEHGNYPRAAHPDKLNWRFYRDRKYVMDCIDRYQFTKLGGVYGDVRDPDYVISYEQRLGEAKDMDLYSAQKDERCLHSFYLGWRHFTTVLHSSECELDEGREPGE